MVLIDVQKEFNVIYHKFFYKKFWFYVYDRIFLVETENKLSDCGKISCRVPQGSSLGTLLFLIYVNDMPQAAKANFLSYADALCLMYQHKDIAEIEKIFNEDLMK